MYVIKSLRADLEVKVFLEYNIAVIHSTVKELFQNNPTFIP